MARKEPEVPGTVLSASFLGPTLLPTPSLQSIERWLWAEPQHPKFQALYLNHQHSRPNATALSPSQGLLPGCAPLGLPDSPSQLPGCSPDLTWHPSGHHQPAWSLQLRGSGPPPPHCPLPSCPEDMGPPHSILLACPPPPLLPRSKRGPSAHPHPRPFAPPPGPRLLQGAAPQTPPATVLITDPLPAPRTPSHSPPSCPTALLTCCSSTESGPQRPRPPPSL